MEGGVGVRVRVIFPNHCQILTDTQESVEKLNRSWVLLNPIIHRTIADVASHLNIVFTLHHSCPHGISLSMDGFVLPPFESTNILKDQDMISVKRKKRGTLDEIVKKDEVNLIQGENVVNKNLVGIDVRYLKNGESADESDGYQNENEEREVNVGKDLLLADQSAGIIAGSKKRKTSKKLQNGMDKCKGKTSTETAMVTNARKSTDKKEITEKRQVADEELEKDTTDTFQMEFQEKLNSFSDGLLLENNSAVKVAVPEKRKASRELDSPNGRKKKKRAVLYQDTETDFQAEQIEPCHSPRVGQHNRECDINVQTNKCSGMSSGMTVENSEKVLELANEHEREKAPPRAEENDVFVEPLPIPKGVSVVHENGTESVDVPLTSERTTKKVSKSTRRIYEKRKFKKELKAEARELLAEKVLIPHTHPPEKHIDTNQYHPNGVIIRPGHIRFEPYKKDQVVQQSSVVMEKNQWPTSKRKNRKLGERKIREYCTRSKCKYSSGGEYQQATAIIGKAKSLDNLNEFNGLPLLTSCPKEGDVIAYRVMEHTENGSILSSYRVGKTLRLDDCAKTLLLTSLEDNPAATIKPSNCSWEQRQDNSINRESGYIEIDVAYLYDVRIVKYAPGNEVDVWDSLSQSSSVKNSLLTRKIEWGKVGPTTTPSIKEWSKADPTTTSSRNEWRKPGPTATSPGSNWGDAVPKTASLNKWGNAASNTTSYSSKWKKACPNTTPSKQEWCNLNPSTSLSNNEWAKVSPTTTSSDNPWEKSCSTTTSSDNKWEKMGPSTTSPKVWGKARPAMSSWRKELSNAGPTTSSWSSKFRNDAKQS